MGQLSHHYRDAIRRHEAVVVTGPKMCDIHNHEHEAQYDGKTWMGPWANMCEDSFQSIGVGLGLGKGQRLLVQEYDPDGNDGVRTDDEIREDVKAAIESGSYEDFEDAIGDRDPAEFL